MDFLTAKRGYAAVTDAVASGTTVEALTKACEVKDAVVSCGQMDGYLAWLNSPPIGSMPIVADLPALLITLVPVLFDSATSPARMWMPDARLLIVEALSVMFPD